MAQIFPHILGISHTQEDGIKGICLVAAMWPVAIERSLWQSLLNIDHDAPLDAIQAAIDEAIHYQSMPRHIQRRNTYIDRDDMRCLAYEQSVYV